MDIFKLPANIIKNILEFDSTYHEQYKKILNEIKMFPVWNVKHVADENSITDYYFHYTIAANMLRYWNKTYTNYISNLLSSSNSSLNREYNERRELINFLDKNNISNEISGRKQTLFQWIRYYRKAY
jgi:hypothetical protein